MKFETILTAFVFKRVFPYSTPVSKYLQTKGLDVMTAYRKKQSLWTSLSNIKETLSDIHKKAKEFALSVINERFVDAAELNEKIFRKRKRLTFNKDKDEVESLWTAIAHFEIDPYRTRLDKLGTVVVDWPTIFKEWISLQRNCLSITTIIPRSRSVATILPKAFKQDRKYVRSKKCSVTARFPVVCSSV